MRKLDAQMTDEIARGLLADALDRLYAADADLPDDVNERTVARQLARHLESALHARADLDQAPWRVDCDDNRLGLAKKRLSKLQEMLASVAGELGWPKIALLGKATGRVAPDITIHQRRSGVGAGASAANILVCELQRVDADKRDLAFDLAKLALYRSELGYGHAFLVLLGRHRDDCVIHRAETTPAEIARYIGRLDEAAAVRRWRRGQAMAAHRARSLLAEQGPRPAQAIAESLSALNALDEMGMWPAPRDPVSERAIQQVRRRWARVQQRAKQARSR